MAYLIYTKDKNGVTQYARTIGQKGVKWTTERDEARRFARQETAAHNAERIMREGWHPVALALPEGRP